MQIETRFLTLEDDLGAMVAQINAAAWDDGNDICAYDAQALRAYLQRQDTLFVSCHGVENAQRVLLGIASARVEMKPYAHECWLYVDEVDVCTDQRQKGAGKAMMQLLIAYAHENSCEEVWLGTEVDNLPANALYSALEPDIVEQFVGYTFETDE